MRPGEAFGLTPHRQENTDACPDCRANVELTEQHPGVWRYLIEHDHTCPWYADHLERLNNL